MSSQKNSLDGITDLPYDTEELRVTQKTVSALINVLTGKEGDIWVCYSESLNTSGYGNTEKEAQDSFSHNFEVFCESLLELKSSQQQKELKTLGWEQKKFAKKQFSKAYVDENGVLQNLTNGKIQPLSIAV